MASPALSDAWAKYYASTKEDNLATYEAAGWKTIASIAAESGQSLATVSSQMKTLTAQKSFEKKMIRAKCSNGIREVAIFRPSCQRRANSSAKH